MSDATKLQLYITSGTNNSQMALSNLQNALHEHPEASASLEVIDLRSEPMRALQDGIVAVPTLQLTRGVFRARLIGDLSQVIELRNFLVAAWTDKS